MTFFESDTHNKEKQKSLRFPPEAGDFTPKRVLRFPFRKVSFLLFSAEARLLLLLLLLLLLHMHLLCEYDDRSSNQREADDTDALKSISRLH